MTLSLRYEYQLKMNKLPFMLIWSRIILGAFIPVIALMGATNDFDAAHYILTMIIVGIITDIFDGVIARRLQVDTPKLRIWDSNVDLFFWLSATATTFFLNDTFFQVNYIPILIVLIMEAIAYFVSFIKFRKTIATHSILAKIWTLSLLFFLSDVLLHTTSHYPFWTCITLGIVSRLEIILILLKMKKWQRDVKSVFTIQ